ncbi:hypothetical protein FTUN_0023 [Frigoriglobus tundricola]|uniref:RHS repeat-associated core domain-containing protein n=1 Tax=Frigoriglobus tundricola TaxID=2774151 RepID=A0A6M5YEU2_9BACT|nr:hypothetical protein FTUN_0023 [Frigoriglobus tundricola]
MLLSKDPLEERGGQTNGYTYCANDPVNRTDPSGNRLLVPACLLDPSGRDSHVGRLVRDELYDVYGTKHPKAWTNRTDIDLTIGHTDVLNQHTYGVVDLFDRLPAAIWGEIAKDPNPHGVLLRGALERETVIRGEHKGMVQWGGVDPPPPPQRHQVTEGLSQLGNTLIGLGEDVVGTVAPETARDVANTARWAQESTLNVVDAAGRAVAHKVEDTVQSAIDAAGGLVNAAGTWVEAKVQQLPSPLKVGLARAGVPGPGVRPDHHHREPHGGTRQVRAQRGHADQPADPRERAVHPTGGRRQAGRVHVPVRGRPAERGPEQHRERAAPGPAHAGGGRDRGRGGSTEPVEGHQRRERG